MPTTKVDIQGNIYEYGVELANSGAPGEPGAPGEAATITAGTTTTGAPGTQAAVTQRGTAQNRILDFTIPAGADGEAGEDGTAATVAVGNTVTGAPGTQASVTQRGTDQARILDFTIPQGADGAAGTAATVAVGNTTTGAAGTNATVTQRGTAQARIFDFTIPRGATGAGLQILGHYDTESQLSEAHPTGNPGDMYTVGTTQPYDIFVWDEVTSVWFDQGQFGGTGSNGTVTAVNDIDPDTEGRLYVDAGNIPFDDSIATPVSTRETINQLSSDVDSVSTSLTTVSGNVSTLQGQMSTAQSNITTAQGQITSLQTDVSGVESSVSTLSTNLGTVQSGLGTAQTNITNLQTANNTLTSNLEDLEVWAQTSTVSFAATIPASGWTNGTYTLNNANIKSTSDGTLSVQAVNQAMYDAWAAAKPYITSQGNGSFVVTCYGDVPTINIGVLCVVFNPLPVS